MGITKLLVIAIPERPDRCAGSGINMQPSLTARFRVSSSAAADRRGRISRSSSAIIGVRRLKKPPGSARPRTVMWVLVAVMDSRVYVTSIGNGRSAHNTRRSAGASETVSYAAITAMPEKLRDQPNARADSQRRRCYPFQRTQVSNPFAGIIKVQRVGANLVAWTSDLDVRGNVYHDGLTNRLVVVALVEAIERGRDDGVISIATVVALGTNWRMLHVRVVAAESLQFVQDLEKRRQDKITPRATAVAPLLSILQRMTPVSATIARLISATSMASFTLLSKESTACLL